MRQLLTTGATHLPTSRSNVEGNLGRTNLGTHERFLAFAGPVEIRTSTVTSTLAATIKLRKHGRGRDGRRSTKERQIRLRRSQFRTAKLSTEVMIIIDRVEGPSDNWLLSRNTSEPEVRFMEGRAFRGIHLQFCQF